MPTRPAGIGFSSPKHTSAPSGRFRAEKRATGHGRTALGILAGVHERICSPKQRGDAVRVMPIIGEDTVFLVESRSLQCPKCTRRFGGNGKLTLGDPCPFCVESIVKRMIPHRVDVARMFPIGQCGCWHAAKLKKQIEQLTLRQRAALTYEEQEKLRCHHIKLARSFALNREMWRYEKKRLNGASEERQP